MKEAFKGKQQINFVLQLHYVMIYYLRLAEGGPSSSNVHLGTTRAKTL